MDAEAKREKIRQLEQTLREEELEAYEKGLTCKRKDELASKRLQQGDVVTRLSQVDVQTRRENLKRIEDEAKTAHTKHQPARVSEKVLEVVCPILSCIICCDSVSRLAGAFVSCLRGLTSWMLTEEQAYVGGARLQAMRTRRRFHSLDAGADWLCFLHGVRPSLSFNFAYEFSHIGAGEQVDLERKKEYEQEMQEQKRLQAAAEEAALSAKAHRVVSETSRQLSEELAAKRAAQGDIITRLAHVDVQHKAETRKRNEGDPVTSANCQSVFMSGLRSHTPKATPKGGISTKSTSRSSSSKSPTPTGDSAADASPASPEKSDVQCGRVVQRLFQEGAQKVMERRRSPPYIPLHAKRAPCGTSSECQCSFVGLVLRKRVRCKHC